MLWQKIKDNNSSNKKISNVVITGGGSQLDDIEKYVEMIFASGTRVARPLNDFNLKNGFNNPSYCDVIGTIMYDPNIYKIDFLEKSHKTKKNLGFSSFFSWLDQYI